MGETRETPMSRERRHRYPLASSAAEGRDCTTHRLQNNATPSQSGGRMKLYTLRVPFLAVLALLGFLLPCPAVAADAPKPNLLLILSDDHSYPFVGCYGNPNVKTPNLDRFAAEGMKL